MGGIYNQKTRALLAFLERLYASPDISSLTRCILNNLPNLIVGDNFMVSQHNPADQQHSQLCLRYPVERENLLLAVHESGAMKDHPLWEPADTADGTKVLSDMMSARTWRSHPMYCEMLRHEGVHDHITVEFELPGAQNVMIGLSRTRRGFHQRDRQTLAMLQPHFKQAFQNARLLEACRNHEERTRRPDIPAFNIDYSAQPAQNPIEAWAPAFGSAMVSLMRELKPWIGASVDFLNRGGLETDIVPLRFCSNGQTFTFHLTRRWGLDGYELSGVIEQAPARQKQKPLGRREQEVLQWVRAGKSNDEISVLLDISPHTVNDHLKNIYRKLNVNNRTAAALHGMMNAC